MAYDLSQNGVGASADVLRATSYAGAPVLPEFHCGFCLHSRRQPCARGNAPPESQPIPFHRTHFRGPSRPAELLSTDCQTFLHMARRERNLEALVDLGFIL